MLILRLLEIFYIIIFFFLLFFFFQLFFGVLSLYDSRQTRERQETRGRETEEHDILQRSSEQESKRGCWSYVVCTLSLGQMMNLSILSNPWSIFIGNMVWASTNPKTKYLKTVHTSGLCTWHLRFYIWYMSQAMKTGLLIFKIQFMLCDLRLQC